jgi:hypothetical protein
MEVTAVWLLAFGILTALLGCCVLFALRQMTFLRACFNKINADILTVQKQQADTARLLDQQATTDKSQGKEAAAVTSSSAADIELQAKLKRLEQDIAALQQARSSMKNTDLGERRATIVGSPDLGHGASESFNEIKRQASVVSSVASPTAVNDSRGVEKMYQEILAELREMQGSSSVVNTSAMAAAVGSPVKRGGPSSSLSVVTPPTVAVYEEQLSDPSIAGVRYKRRLMSFVVATESGDAAIVLGQDSAVSGGSSPPAMLSGATDQPTRILLKEVVTIRISCGIMPGDHTECVVLEITRQLPAQRKVVRPAIKAATSAVTRLQIPSCPAVEAWVSFLDGEFPEKIVLGHMDHL